jgi:anti-sigma factor RsiW
MNHQEATELTAVERYLLNELTPALRGEFEEHYFGCQECAADLRATAAFLQAAKVQLQPATVQLQPATEPRRTTTPRAASPRKSWFSFFGTPAFLSPAFGLLLVVVIYQNVLVFPRVASDATGQQGPEIMPSLSLVGGDSRGAGRPSVTLNAAQSFVMAVDIPTADRFSSYDCVLVSPSGSTLWSLRVSAQVAKDTVSIRVPAVTWKAGDYTLTVRGNSPGSSAVAAVALADFHFILNSRK